MKKQALFVTFFLSAGILAGCEMPFAPSEKEALTKYVEEQAITVQSSLEMDEHLQASLQATLKETEKKVFPAEKLFNEIRSAKDAQNALYQRVQIQEMPYGKEKVKQVYLDVIEAHLDSYTQYEQQLKKKDRKAFTTSLVQNQIKEENVLTQSLLLINSELAQYKVKSRDTLLPIEEKK